MSEPSQPQESPPKDKPSPLAKGAKWGALAGFIVAQFAIQRNSPLGFYTGNMMLLFTTCIGTGAAIGAAIGWLSTQVGDDERFPG